MLPPFFRHQISRPLGSCAGWMKYPVGQRFNPESCGTFPGRGGDPDARCYAPLTPSGFEHASPTSRIPPIEAGSLGYQEGQSCGARRRESQRQYGSA